MSVWTVLFGSLLNLLAASATGVSAAVSAVSPRRARSWASRGRASAPASNYQRAAWTHGRRSAWGRRGPPRAQLSREGFRAESVPCDAASPITVADARPPGRVTRVPGSQRCLGCGRTPRGGEGWPRWLWARCHGVARAALCIGRARLRRALPRGGRGAAAAPRDRGFRPPSARPASAISPKFNRLRIQYSFLYLFREIFGDLRVETQTDFLS